MRSQTGYEIRPYVDADEPAVLRLLEASLGRGPAGVRDARFFRWKHIDNPFGRSYMFVAVEADEIVGLRAFMRWSFDVGPHTVRAARAVDTATHPAHRGRGVFSALTRHALEAVQGEIDFIFNTPNEKSLPGYLKMGWEVVGRVPVAVRVNRPLRFLTGGHIGDPPRTDERLARARSMTAGCSGDLRAPLTGGDGRLRTSRSKAYLQWRYGDAPYLDYRAVASGEALLLIRIRTRGKLVEGGVSDIVTTDTAEARELVRMLLRTRACDHLTAVQGTRPFGSKTLRRSGFLPVPKGPTLVVHWLNRDLIPDPRRIESWALSLGDVEVF